MRRVATNILVTVMVVTSLGAAREAKSGTPGTKAKTHTQSTPSAKAKSKTSRSAQPRRRGNAFQVGRASWYGKHFHGRKTASGEKYDMFQFTAAHPDLPLGTMLKVTNLRNQRWVIVRVNDRGPVPRSRIIDLSYGAAQILGLRAPGVERVRLDVVEPDEIALSAERTEIAGLQ